MKKPTFKIALRDGSFIDQSYTPLIYTRMTSVFRFALYKSGRDWIVSEPVSGYRVCRVSAQFKGMPVASGHLTLKQARECALIDIDAIVDRIGFDAFENRMNEAITTLKAAA